MANKTKVSRGTPLVFDDSGTDYAITLQNMLSTVGRVSARANLGAGSTSRLFDVRLTVQMDTSCVVGETIECYISTSDGTRPDGEVGEIDAALVDANVLPNLKWACTLVIQQTSATTDMTASGQVQIPTRYFSVVVYNASADSLENTVDVSTVTVTAVDDELQ